jgi:hypothetical protein
MTILSISLLPDAVAKVHNAIVCLSKFSEEITIDAHRSQVGTSFSAIEGIKSKARY